MSRLPRAARLAPVIALLSVGAARPAAAQSWLDRAKQRAKTRIDQQVDRRVDRAVDSASSRLPGGGGGRTTPAANPGGGSAAASATAANAPAAARPGEGAWANYDFKPGDRVLFADDFSQDEVGNFPRRLQFVSGSIDMVEWQGRRWLSSGNTGELQVPLPAVLPERFTMEFDLAGSGNAMTVSFDGKTTYIHRETGVDRLEFGTQVAGVKGAHDASGPTGYNTERVPVKVRIAVDGEYAKVYVNEKRVANVPNARLGRSNKIYLALNGWNADAPRMIADIRVAAGGKRLYDALATNGRAATQGVYFDTGADRVRPESSPTLKEIAGMLAEHPDLRLAIEGHTDAVGAADANLALSQRRADAVKAALVSSYGVDAARLTARGMGAGKPVAPNTTLEGRQTNRRVELVRL